MILSVRNTEIVGFLIVISGDAPDRKVPLLAVWFHALGFMMMYFIYSADSSTPSLIMPDVQP